MGTCQVLTINIMPGRQCSNTTCLVYRLNGEIAERQFCDEHLLSLPTLGMAAEAKVMTFSLCM